MDTRSRTLNCVYTRTKISETEAAYDAIAFDNHVELVSGHGGR